MKAALILLAAAFPYSLSASDPWRPSSALAMQQPEAPARSARRFINELKPGMDADDVRKMIPKHTGRMNLGCGTAGRFRNVYFIDGDHSLTLDFKRTGRGSYCLERASLQFGNKVIANVGD